MLYDLTKSWKSNITSFNLEVPIYQLLDKMRTEIQRAFVCFRDPAVQWDCRNCLLQPEVPILASPGHQGRPTAHL